MIQLTLDKEKVNLFVKEYREFELLYQELNDDLKLLYQLIQDCKDRKQMQSFLRQFIRGFFALFEGTAFRLKQLTFTFPQLSYSFTSEEEEFLREESIDQSTQGRQKWKRSVDKNFKETIKFYSKVVQVDVSQVFSRSGWQECQRAISIRDRLVHPKKVADIHISEQEFTDVVSAILWFRDDIMSKLLIKGSANINKAVQAILDSSSSD